LKKGTLLRVPFFLVY